MQNKINICLSTDNNYAKYAGVVIASILSNAKNQDDLVFYILDGGIEENKKEEILSLKSIKNCEINFVNIDENLFEEYKKVKSHSYISVASYYRLKLPSLLPEIDKIIYFDCDIIVNSSLEELFNTDFEGNIIAGVKDINRKMLKKNPSYINAGMIVFDLDKMRKNNTEEEFLTYTKNNINKIKTGDQEIINEVLKGKIKIVDEAYNVQSSNFVNRSSYTKNPKIIHFVAKKKPWHWASFSVHKNLYFKNLQLTPWKLDEKEYKHWTKKNQIASIFAYLKYRPLFFIRPRFYYVFYKEYLENLFKQIFSIQEYNETHNLLTILSIRIKFPKNKYEKLRKENPFFDYIKNKVDITKIPPAKGELRKIQLGNFELLKELDYVCKKNNFDYWIDFGTLLGAIRHKGFIPWDDDIDIGMPRIFYNQLLEIFNKDKKNPDIYANIKRHNNNDANYIIRIYHKNIPALFVDIFPYDVYGEKLSHKQQIKMSKYIIKERNKSKCQLRKNGISDNDFKTYIENFRKYILKNGENLPLSSKTDLVLGVDFFHTWPRYFYNYDLIYPLKKISFENIEFPCPNNVDEFLKQIFGDYMAYPKKLGFGHNAYAKMTKEEKEALDELIKETYKTN